MANRVNKISNCLLDKMWENGGHWVELTMKATGDTLFIQRCNFERYEDLANERFRVVKNRKTDKVEEVLEGVPLNEVAEYINTHY